MPSRCITRRVSCGAAAVFGVTFAVVTSTLAQEPAIKAPAGEQLERSLARRAHGAATRASLAAGRAYIAATRIVAELGEIRPSDNLPPLSSIEQPPRISLEVPRTVPAAEALIPAVERLYQQTERTLTRAKQMMHGALPEREMPVGVPEWAAGVQRAYVLRRPEALTPKGVALHLEELAFRTEQLAQETEICEEQAIALRELSAKRATAKSAAAPVQQSAWRFVGPSGVRGGEGYDGSRVTVSGRVTSLAVLERPGASSVLLAGAALGGVWLSLDHGRNWSSVGVNAPIGALESDSRNPGRVYAGTGEANVALRDMVVKGDRVIPGGRGQGVLRSDDYGNTWKQLANKEFEGIAFAELAVASNAHVFAATTGGLYESSDSGFTWRRHDVTGSGNERAVSVAVHKDRPGTVFVAIWGEGVFRTDDVSRASSWERVSGGLPLSNIGRARLVWSEASADVLFALIGNADHRLRGLYTSQDGGVRWSRIDGVPDLLRGQGFYHIMLGADPRDEGIAYVGGAGARGRDASSLYRIRKVSEKWIAEPTGSEQHVDFHAIAFDPSEPRRLFVSNDGGIWRSDDAGATWTGCNDGLGITQVISVAQHPQRADVLLAGTQDNGTLRYESATGWEHVDNGDGGIVAFDPVSPEIAYNVFLGHRLARSELGGRSGSFTPAHPPVSSVNTAFLSPFDLNPTRPSEVVLGADQLYISADRGASWQALDFRFTRDGDAVRRSVISAVRWLSNDVIAVGTSDGDVFRVSRLGGRWSVVRIVASPEWDSTPSFVADISKGVLPGEVFVALDRRNGPALWRLDLDSENDAVPISVAAGLVGPVFTAAVDPCRPQSVIVGTENGVYMSSDGGRSWTTLGIGFPKVAAVSVAVHGTSRLLRVGTFGRGVWELLLPEADKCATATSAN